MKPYGLSFLLSAVTGLMRQLREGGLCGILCPCHCSGLFSRWNKYVWRGGTAIRTDTRRRNTSARFKRRESDGRRRSVLRHCHVGSNHSDCDSRDPFFTKLVSSPAVRKEVKAPSHCTTRPLWKGGPVSTHLDGFAPESRRSLRLRLFAYDGWKVPCYQFDVGKHRRADGLENSIQRPCLMG